jgi:hypothetical protein
MEPAEAATAALGAIIAALASTLLRILVRQCSYDEARICVRSSRLLTNSFVKHVGVVSYGIFSDAHVAH